MLSFHIHMNAVDNHADTSSKVWRPPHPPIVPAGEPSALWIDNPSSPTQYLPDVLPRGRMPPHPGIHGRRVNHRTSGLLTRPRRAQESGDEVIRYPIGHLCKQIGRGGGPEKDIPPIREGEKTYPRNAP